MKTETFQKLVLEKFDSFEKEFVGIKEDISGIKSDITNMKSDIINMKSEITNINKDISLLKKDVSLLKDDYSNLENKVNLIFDQTAKLTEFKTDTIEKLDQILDNQISISEIIGEHEIAIRTLRRKPV